LPMSHRYISVSPKWKLRNWVIMEYVSRPKSAAVKYRLSILPIFWVRKIVSISAKVISTHH